MREASEVENMTEVRLRWFKHVMRRGANALVMRCGRLDIVGMRRDRYRLKKN